MNNHYQKRSCNGHHRQPPRTDAQQILGQNHPTELPERKEVWQQRIPTVQNNTSATQLAENSIPESYKTYLLELTNAERSEKGLSPLQYSPQLGQAAQLHAGDMATNNFLKHKSSDGSLVSERVSSTGYAYFYIGENIAAGNATPDLTVRSWMKNLDHRANILNPNYTEIGFGYFSNPSSSHRYYWVQVFGSRDGEITSHHTVNDQPDFWNYALVTVLSIFYLLSFTSTYISTHLLLSLLSGGAGIAIPIFSTQIAITDAVALMGTGILEGTSLSDAYLEHKKALTESRQLVSRGGRFLAFIAQGLLYYMALGQLLFATTNLSSLGAQGFETSETQNTTQAALILNPPTVLHGAFVGTLSFAWSYGTTYIGPNALLGAIASLRRRSQKGLNNGLKQ